jgi:urease accessory protein
MPWHARLQLDYRLEGARTVARHQHEGPLRILQSLYPEGDAVCHNILVHPPGGLVGGDTLDLRISVGEDAHGLVTTPGATRFYRSDGALALQRTRIDLAPRARLEWLPLETICHNGCQAANRLTLQLAPGAECMGLDIMALGLPHAGQPFEHGQFLQHIDVPGVWLERGQIDATDHHLMRGRGGLDGKACLATFFFVAGSPIARARRDTALDLARGVIAAHPLHPTAGASAANDRVLVVRVLAPMVESAMALLRHIWRSWRLQLWDRWAEAPRIWAT